MIVITGGAGFIGSCLLWKLNELGRQDLLVVDHQGTQPPKTFNLEKRKAADYLERADFLKALDKGRLNGEVEMVIHLGACTDTTEMDKDYLMENNFQYSKRLAEWCVKEAKRFIYASSAATYGDGRHGYSDEDAVSPDLKPLNPYGESKQLFDLWVLEEKLQDKFVGLKFFNVYGPNEYHKGDMRSVVHKGYYQIKKEGKMRLFKSYRDDYADGEQERDFIYVKDVVDVIQWFWNNPQAAGIFNLGTGRAETWNTLANSIFEALNLPSNIEYIEMPESLQTQYQYWTQASLEKLRNIGCQHNFLSLKEGVKDYVQNYLEKSDPYL